MASESQGPWETLPSDSDLLKIYTLDDLITIDRCQKNRFAWLVM